MARKGRAQKRQIIADPVYGSVLVTQLVNKILKSGKKSLAEAIVYGALEGVALKAEGQDPVAVLGRAMDNIRPTVEVRSRRVGGATYQVPVEVKKDRANTLGLRWLTDFSRARREKTMTLRLTHEILDASNGLGAAVKKREDTHKMADANKAFAHYRW
jgi:small subunit ribosomal protein S7